MADYLREKDPKVGLQGSASAAHNRRSETNESGWTITSKSMAPYPILMNVDGINIYTKDHAD